MKNAEKEITPITVKKFNIKEDLLPLTPLLFLVLALILGGLWFYGNYSQKNTISVIGHSETRISNQVADFSLNIEISNVDKAMAVEEVTNKANEIIQQIKDYGIPAEDIETTNINVYQREDQITQGGVIRYEKADWYATYTVTITVRDLEKSSGLTELLASVDSASMWGPSLRVDNTVVNEEKLLTEALADAHSKATALANQSGKKVGSIAHITEISSGLPVMYSYANYDRAQGGGGGFPIEPGTSESSVMVSVTYYLK